MSQRMSMIGGIISFTAVVALSILSLDRVGGDGFFLMGLVTPEVEAPVVETPCSVVPAAEASEAEPSTDEVPEADSSDSKGS